MGSMTNIPADEIEAATERYTKRDYIVGLDLGQSIDPTALSVIERLKAPTLHPGYRIGKLQYTITYRVRHLERLPLGMSYPAIVRHVQRALNTEPLFRNAKLVIDQTGVGRPVFDLFAQARMDPIGISITAGHDWTRETQTQYRVPKSLIVSRLDAALHSGILHIAADLPEAQALKSELADFRVNHTASGYQQFGARSGRHDDLVLSVAIGLWFSATVGNERMQVAKTWVKP